MFWNNDGDDGDGDDGDGIGDDGIGIGDDGDGIGDDGDDQGVRLEEAEVQRILCQLRFPCPDCPDGEKANQVWQKNLHT